MKKIVLVVVFLPTVFIHKSLARDSASQAQLLCLLNSHSIEYVLVAGNTAMALAKAEQFIKTLSSIDHS